MQPGDSWGSAPVRWGEPPGTPQFIPPVPGHPAEAGRVPDGVTWLKIYCGLQVAFHILVIVFGVGMSLAMSVLPPGPASAGDPPPWFIGVVVTVIYLPATAAYVVGLVGPRKPWMYNYGIFLAVLGFLCGGCWFIGVPFLIFWTKPEAKHWYEHLPFE